MEYLVFVSVGTYHYPFNRLVGWVDSWMESNFVAEHGVKTIVQYGVSEPPQVCEGHEMIAYDKLRDLFSRADVVITHGGPSTIMEVREAGKIPLVVPRDPRLDEHVDGHQIRFSEHIQKNGTAKVASSEKEFRKVLEEGLLNPDLMALQDNGMDVPCIEKFGQALDTVLSTHTVLGGIDK